MPWIKAISYDEASGKLKKLYDRIKGPDNNVDNILQIHGLRPHTLEGHMKLYKNVLHHSGNTFPKWFLETIGVYTSMLNACSYCVEHHFAGLRRLLNDDTHAEAIKEALEQERFEGVFDERQIQILAYTKQLTTNPAAIDRGLIDSLKLLNVTDGELLEINQVTAYFAYANRTVLGLGVTIDNDILGLSPGDNDDPDNWSHS